MKKNSRIFIAGSKMIGKALRRRLEDAGFHNLLPKSSARLDLTDQKAVQNLFKKEKPEYCFLSSINEGGIEANIKYPADLIYQNLIAQANIIHTAWQVKVKRLIFLASSCVYPKDCSQPMKEEYLLTGRLESTNEAYSIAKLAGIKMCQAYNKQFATQFISAIPATVFGPNDNFDPGTSHVIPALIRKFHESNIHNKSEVTVWGSGKPRREFIFCDDLADCCIFLMSSARISEIINVGTGFDLSIKQLAELIKHVVGFNGKIKFDKDKPDGVYKKLLDISKLKALNYKPQTDINTGLENTYIWFNETSKSY